MLYKIKNNLGTFDKVLKVQNNKQADIISR